MRMVPRGRRVEARVDDFTLAWDLGCSGSSLGSTGVKDTGFKVSDHFVVRALGFMVHGRLCSGFTVRVHGLSKVGDVQASGFMVE
eukprot:2271378-Rhodomonas_salina.2